MRVRRSRALLGFVLAAAVVVGPPSVPAAGVTATYTWTPIASVPIGTTEAQSVVVHDKVYLFGGFDVYKACCTPTDRAWVYDPAANTWTALPPMPERGISHAGIDTDSVRYIYYAGGYASDAGGTNQVYGTADAWRYDLQTGAYSRLPSLPQPRAAGGLAFVGGALYYFGGSNLARTVDTSDVWELDVAHGATSWVARAPMPGPRNHLGWGVIGGAIYAVGGQHFSDSTTAQSELDRFDPAGNSWTRLTGLPAARSHLMDSTFVVDGLLVAAGGWTTSVVSAAVTAYDPSSGTWQSWPNLPQARTSATARALSTGRIIFCCGSAGTSNNNGWTALPALPTVHPQPPPTSPPTSPPPTSPPPTSPPPVTGPPVASPPPPAAVPALRFSGVALHPSTVRSAVAGKALTWFRISHKATVKLVLRRCVAGRCTAVVAHRTVTSPKGLSHVSLHTLTGHTVIAAGHYRLSVTPAGARTVVLKLVVLAR